MDYIIKFFGYIFFSELKDGEKKSIAKIISIKKANKTIIDVEFFLPIIMQQPPKVNRVKGSGNKGIRNSVGVPSFPFIGMAQETKKASWAPLPKKRRTRRLDQNDLNDVQCALFQISISSGAPGAPFKRRAGGLDQRDVRNVRRCLFLVQISPQAPGAPFAAEKRPVAQGASEIEEVRARLFF